MPNDRQILVASIYCNKKEDFKRIFINTDLTPTQMRVFIIDKFIKSFRRGSSCAEIFGQKFTVEDLLNPTVLEEWRSCKSLEVYKEKMFNRERYDFNLTIESLENFVNGNVLIFERTYGGNPLSDLAGSMFMNSPVFAEATENNTTPNRGEVEQLRDAVVAAIE